MKDKIPKSDKAQKREEKQARGTFAPCRVEINGGASRKPHGAECYEGYWYYWATAHDQEGRDMYGKPVRWARECECLKAWRRGGTLAGVLEGKNPQPALMDSKAKAAGQ